MEIKLTKDLNENKEENIAEAFIDIFGNILKNISEDKNILKTMCSNLFKLEEFYVCEMNHLGLCVYSYKEHYCIKPNREILMNNLGQEKGTLANTILKKFFNKYPKYLIEIDVKTGFIHGEGVNTQEPASQGSLGAVKKVLSPESNSLREQHTSRLAAGLLIEFVETNLKYKEMPIAISKSAYYYSMNMHEAYLTKIAETDTPDFDLSEELDYKLVNKSILKHSKYLVYMEHDFPYS
ncbi:hypothetical protein [Leadbettera azotonutricia]|uniref:Uncharacterized protein n=1 Tax=Leadbettera azotonutricia (strain ATCC BAA-888 / DSM 13862 / ZAS-9) TaxID=545695 RepID=F5YFR5_LEAAZ|nr:hypothetical protein [Leadbettera azotonutricia]AEF83388.1 conserved hypothetical protein [Leadbettera azotonutricia ZAS-9]